VKAPIARLQGWPWRDQGTWEGTCYFGQEVRKNGFHSTSARLDFLVDFDLIDA
jgi:hypothetical protein